MSEENDPMLNAVKANLENGENPRILSIGPDGEATIVDGDDLDNLFAGELDEEEETEDLEFFPEGTEVSVTAPVDMNKPDVELTLTGKVRGISMLPTGMSMMPGYIIELDEPHLVPDGPKGEKFEYTCIVFPIGIVSEIIPAGGSDA